MVWADFEGGSGMDNLGVLGTGVVREMIVLTPRVVRKLTSGLVRDPEAKPPKTAPPVPPLGKTAIVNFDGVTPAKRHRVRGGGDRGGDERSRSSSGVEMVSPGCTGRVLRLQRGIGWGGVSEQTRAALREDCGAESILTGSVETYDVGGSSTEPEPRVAFGMRFLDAESGKILWTGSVERDGWDREGLFEFGRIHSQAQLTRRIMGDLARQLVKERTRQTRMN